MKNQTYATSGQFADPNVGDPQLDSIVPARMPEQSNPEQRGDSSVPGDSRVRVSDKYAWIDKQTKRSGWSDIAKKLLAEVRRLEQITQVTEGQ